MDDTVTAQNYYRIQNTEQTRKSTMLATSSGGASTPRPVAQTPGGAGAAEPSDTAPFVNFDFFVFLDFFSPFTGPKFA